MRRITAIIIDDHRVVSEGLAKVLESDGRVEVVGLAASLSEAEVLSRHIQPDAVLLDLKLPDATGYNGIDAAKGFFPVAKIVAITGFGDMAKSAAKRHGADAFLTKELASDIVAETICSFFGEPMEEASDVVHLTRRESDVARLVADGFSNEEVATALNLSVNTVKSHLSSVLTKMKLRDRVALALSWHRRDSGA